MNGAPPSSTHHRATFHASVGSAPVTHRTTNTFAADAKVVIDARFNGHRPRMVWNDSPQQTEFAWRGAIVIVSFHKKAGPATVRIANARLRAVGIQVSFSW